MLRPTKTVRNATGDGSLAHGTCKKFEIVSFNDDGRPYKAHLWETMEAVVAGSSFSAFLGNNGTLLKSDTAHIHKKVFEELHKLDALPMELNAILTIPRDAASDVDGVASCLSGISISYNRMAELLARSRASRE